MILINCKPIAESDITSESHSLIKPDNFQTAIAIDSLYLLTTAVNSKIIEFFGFNSIHILKYICLYTAKTGTIGIYPAFSAVMVKVNAPSPLAHHTQV
jgi:hypothetical protein